VTGGAKQEVLREASRDGFTASRNMISGANL
jgi:hypothetical protein